MVPVILLAFANDKQNSGSGYLRGLTLERNGIRDALMKAEENGLCQVLVEPDITIDRLFDIFQNSNYRDRIAIFHYGGHAESYSLLLESASGGKATAHSEGLVAFLAKQKSLKLVFLNGCSSQKQSEDLIAAGLPAVIGTSQSINDTIATTLSNRFYKGMAAGMTVEGSWTDAVDQIKTENGRDHTALYTEGILGSPMEDLFPWKLFTGEGGEISKAWNLPEAANQPLFGLELPKSFYRKLPLVPYAGLRSFKREEAAIFYGRGNDIRRLYTQIGRPQPVIVLSGKSGIGKSSLLTAGLIPRIENDFAIAHAVIENNTPADALGEALNQVRESLSLAPIAPENQNLLLKQIADVESSVEITSGFAKEVLEAELARLKLVAERDYMTYYERWIDIEEITGKPLIVILDELPQQPETWNAFVNAMLSIFEVDTAPKGKLIISIDQETHDPFCLMLQAEQIPYAETFLEPLTPDGIQEAIVGVTYSPVTRDFYKLKIEDTSVSHLPQAIMTDLTDGDQTLVAPYLQLILSSLWESAHSQNAQAPVFTLHQYQQNVLSGEIVNGFLVRQLTQLKEWNEDTVESGLALDLLYLHTSALGKSSLLTTQKRNEIYNDRKTLIEALISQCKKLWLLSGTDQQGTRLGHNLLALVVIRQYSISLSPGQQAARILNSRSGETTSTGKSLWLNEEDLEDVESGLPGMRSLNEKEEALLAYSRVKKEKAQRDRKRNKIIRGVLVSIIALFGIMAAWQWQVANEHYRYSRAGELAFYAKEACKVDNTVAMNIARKAFGILKSDSPPEVMQTLSEIFHSQDKSPFYSAKFEHTKLVNTAVFSADGQQVLTASEDGKVKLWDRQGRQLKVFPHETEVFMAAFSPNGQQILTITRTNVRLWEKDGRLVDENSLPDIIISLDSFTTDGMKLIPAFVKQDTSAFGVLVSSLRREDNQVIASPSRNRILVLHQDTCTLYDKEGHVVRILPSSSFVSAVFSPGGEKFVTGTRSVDTCFINIWNEAGDSVFNFKCIGEKVNVVFSPDGKSLLTAGNGFSAKAWDFTDPFLHRFPRQRQAINTIDFFQEGNRYLTAAFDSTAKIFDVNGRMIDSLKHNGVVVSAWFSPDGDRIVTASQDSMARIWFPKESRTVVLRHRAEVTSAVFSHDGKSVLTASLDSLARLWTQDGVAIDSFHLKGEVYSASFAPDDQNFVTITSDSTTSLWRMSGEKLTVLKHPARIFSVSFSPDGSKLLTSCADSIVRQWSSSGKLQLSMKHREKPRLAIYSADGNQIITGGRIVKIWNANGILLDSMGHTENISSIVVSPDNKLILTTCFDYDSYLWNFNGKLLARFKGHTAKINAGSFTQDGQHILTVADDGYILRWNTPEAIFSKLRTSNIASLSAKEEERYGIQLWKPKDIINNIKRATIGLLSPKEKE